MAVLVLAAVAVRIPLLGGPQIDYDEGVYWESLRSMAAGHPLFSSVYSSQPPGFLAAIYPFYLLGHSLVAARAGVLVFFAAALVATFFATRVLLGERAALLATLVMAVDPLVLRQSVALQADGPALALGMVALALALHQPQQRSSRWNVALPVLAGAALAAAVQVKLLAVVFAVPVILVLYWRRRLLLGAAGVVVGTAVVLLPFAFRLGLVWRQAVAGHVDARALDEGGFGAADMHSALVREALTAAVGVLGAFVLFSRRADRVMVLLGAWLVAVLAVMVVQRPLWPHHLVIAVPPLAIAAGTLANVLVPRTVVAVLTATAAAMLLLVGERALDNPATADTVAASVAVMRHVLLPGDLVITDDQFSAAQAGFDTPPDLVDTSVVRLRSQPVTAADVERSAMANRVRVVYTGTNRLSQLDGLLAWIEQHYPQRFDVGHNAVVHVAPAP
jgi:4-amino-4-deoxy-L-arabinose transferase-like glycosyltransferase